MGSGSCCTDSCCRDSGRAFLTREEKVERLTDYKDWLSHELKGVEEAISDLKKAK
jgi:hypothetical protein